MNFITPQDAEGTEYDVVIVGGGIAGALVAKTLTRAGNLCLIVEAGSGAGMNYEGYVDYLHNFWRATVKIPNAPYPQNPNAPEPMVTDTRQIKPVNSKTSTPIDEKDRYFVQNGPLPFSSDYTKYLGGTTLHWLGTSLRMLPEDFHLNELYGVGIDWPIRYQDLEPWYVAAERELGVSADVAEQAYHGVTFPQDYVYPMHPIPASWSDKQLAKRINGMQVEAGGKAYTLQVRGTPAARNSIPNDKYDNNKGYQPLGAVGNNAIGHRCMGNTSCVPICPIQAKYNALKTLNTAHPDLLDILLQSVAYELEIDPASKAITGVWFKHYEHSGNPAHTRHKVTGKRYVLAGHAVGNAVLLLASKACQGNDLVGRHLMDHPELLAWGLAKEPLWPLRGPLATSGIEELRGGDFRQKHAAFRFEMGNDGWLWPANAPSQNVINLVDNARLTGTALRQELLDSVSRQFRFGILVEQLPEYENRVSIREDRKDALGNYRPVIDYNLSDYTRDGFAAARDITSKIFIHAGIDDYSSYPEDAPGAFECKDGRKLVFYGAGHFAGTHCMGSDPKKSVVNREQRSWEHPNLWLVGCGNMLNMGTSNPTLTMSALTLWAADNILRDIAGGQHA